MEDGDGHGHGHVDGHVGRVPQNVGRGREPRTRTADGDGDVRALRSQA